MDERQQIDWSQVIPGKTWLESPNGCLCRVDAVVGEDVWVYYKSKQNLQALHYTWIKSAITLCKWQIREEWENVTHECTFEERPMTGVRVFVAHRGVLISLEDGNYKVTPRSIYKRRTL